MRCRSAAAAASAQKHTAGVSSNLQKAMITNFRWAWHAGSIPPTQSADAASARVEKRSAQPGGFIQHPRGAQGAKAAELKINQGAADRGWLRSGATHNRAVNWVLTTFWRGVCARQRTRFWNVFFGVQFTRLLCAFRVTSWSAARCDAL